MGYSNIKRCSYDVETTFGTDFSESWKDLPIIEETYRSRLLQGALPDRTAVQSLHHRNPHRRGSQFGSGFSADFVLDGLAAGLAAGVAYSAPQSGMAGLLRAYLGGAQGNSGSLADDTSGGGAATTTEIPVTAGQGSRFAVGTALMVNGIGRYVQSRSTDRLTLNQALPAAAVPANGTPIYNSVTLYPDPSEVGGDGDSLVVRILGDEAEDQVIYRGCVPVVESISASIEEIITCAVNMMAASHEEVTGHSIGLAAPVGGGALPLIAGRVWASQLSGTLNGALAAHRFSFAPNMGIRPAKNLGSATIAAIQTVSRWRQARQAAVLEAAVRFHNQADWDDWFDFYHSLATTMRPKLRIALQWGNTPIAGSAGTGAIMIGMRSAFWSTEPEHVEEDGEISQVMRFESGLDFSTGTSNTLAEAPWSISLF